MRAYMNGCLFVLAAAGLLAVDGAAAFGQVKPMAAFDPTSNYTQHDVLGWKVLVNRRLDDDAKLKQAALREIESQLYQVTRLVSPKVVSQLRETAFWLEKSAPARSAYHPDRKWLIRNGYNPDKAKCIEIASAEQLLSLPAFRPEIMLLHELLHAYHDQVLGFEHPAIIEAFKRVKKQQKYERVRHIYGGYDKHYALTNAKEFFAELSETYLFANDYYPFVRPELKSYDPETYALMKMIWSGREYQRGE